MKPIKKYNEGGKSDDWKPENWDSLPENKRRLLRIKHKAEVAFDSGDIEKAKKLAAKADKIDKRQAKWKKKIEDFGASQAAKAQKIAKSKNAFSSMDELMREMQMRDVMNSAESPGQNMPSPSGGGAVQPAPRTRTASRRTGK